MSTPRMAPNPTRELKYQGTVPWYTNISMAFEGYPTYRA